eukprot:13154683-Heterocapsa_arctica.AAC.1
MAAFRTHGLAPLEVDRLVLARNLALDLLVLALELQEPAHDLLVALALGASASLALDLLVALALDLL